MSDAGRMVAGSRERTLATGRHQRTAGSGIIRTGSPADAEAIRDLVCRLSPRSLYFRFFASVAPPSTGLLRALSGVTGSADILLITDASGALIGHGMAADVFGSAGGLETNIGLMIADDWQRRGLGTMLLTELVNRAARRGVCGLVLDVLPENDPMRRIIRRRWPDVAAERTRDALIFRPLIGSAEAAPPMVLPAALDLRGCDRRASSYAGGSRVPNRHAA
jgi:GNAT superfamily N-acetyltransferase